MKNFPQYSATPLSTHTHTQRGIPYLLLPSTIQATPLSTHTRGEFLISCSHQPSRPHPYPHTHPLEGGFLISCSHQPSRPHPYPHTHTLEGGFLISCSHQPSRPHPYPHTHTRRGIPYLLLPSTIQATLLSTPTHWKGDSLSPAPINCPGHTPIHTHPLEGGFFISCSHPLQGSPFVVQQSSIHHSSRCTTKATPLATPTHSQGGFSPACCTVP